MRCGGGDGGVGSGGRSGGKLPRVLFAGTASGVGKTLICAGLILALRRRGYRVQPFKVGPDYIDPGYHTRAAGVPCRNLDSFLMDEATVTEIFVRHAVNADISIIEGVRGLYEGVSVDGDEGSTAHIAKILRTPVILILNARSITKSAAAIVLGFKSLDPDVGIGGVILNNVFDEEHSRKLVRAIENYVGVPVLGALPRSDALSVGERHLGLLTALENAVDLRRVADFVEEHVAVGRVVELAEMAPPLPPLRSSPGGVRSSRAAPAGGGVRLAVAYDNAFNFYYQDSLDVLRGLGCRILFFSPMRDAALPECDGLYLGGGYPEVFAAELSRNKSMLRSVRRAAEDEMPVYAECGGLIYLSRAFEFEGGGRFEFVGFLPCDVRMRRRHIGYTVNQIISKTILGDGGILRGHEFHYTECEVSDDVRFAYKMLRGSGIVSRGGENYDGIVQGATLAAYTHLHFAACRKAAENFVASLRAFSKR
ncbi:MAG: cobyrinate a,c-diamide synthase [Candidatus Alkanophagales archaeon]